MDLEDCPGNQGLYDIVTAIEWIKDNAHVFGGDKENVNNLLRNSRVNIVSRRCSSSDKVVAA